MNALVYNLDLEKNLVWIAYPWRLFDRGGNIQNIFTYIAGNVLGMKTIKALKLLDVWFPPAMLEQYDGPSYTVDDMREYLNIYDRPILGTIINQKWGLPLLNMRKLLMIFGQEVEILLKMMNHKRIKTFVLMIKW